MSEVEGNKAPVNTPETPNPPAVLVADSQVPSGYVPASEKDTAAAAARREGEGEGKKTAERSLLERYGVENLDDLDTAVKAARDGADAEKSAQEKLTDREAKLSTERETAKSEKDRADRYETALTGYLESEREGIPEHLTALLDRMDVVEQLTYISENRAALKPEDEKPEVKRAPDATRRSTVEEKLSPRELVSSAFVKR